jgi:hypothetical protein
VKDEVPDSAFIILDSDFILPCCGMLKDRQTIAFVKRFYRFDGVSGAKD